LRDVSPVDSVCVSFDEVGRACFQKMHELGASIRALITLDDTLRAKRSGQCPFESLAEQIGAPLLKCRNINDQHILDALEDISPDLIFVIGWSQLLKPQFICKARHGVLGMHPTMLPKHRGRAPLPWAMISGLQVTAVSLFYIAEEADNGELLAQIEIPIYRVDNAERLWNRVLRAHVQLIEENYPLLEKGKAPRIRQDEARASHWQRRKPADGIIDWCCDASALYDWIRALGKPYPGAFTYCQKGKVTIWASDLPVPLNGHKPGAVVALDCRGALVQTGSAGLWLTHVQLDGDENEYEGHEVTATGIFTLGEMLG